MILGGVLIGYFYTTSNRSKNSDFTVSSNTAYSYTATPTFGTTDRTQGRTIETFYGSFYVHEPVLLELFDSPVMQRLKGIRQYGVLYYVDKKEYNRYEHSVGVWAILRRYGACLEEQIAGLLHDASHTVFSHVADALFKHTSTKNSYQDDIHEWYLQQQKVPELLAKHGISLESVMHKSGKHRMAEQDLPDLCADRIEYNLYGGLLENMITKNDIEPILQTLKFKDGRWFFTDIMRAQQFSQISLYHTEYVWGGLSNFVTYKFAAQALRRAVDIKLLSFDDIHFSVDDIVWNKMCQSKDGEIKTALNNLLHHGGNFIQTDKPTDLVITTKFRGVNPWVLVDGDFKRLTDCNKAYAQAYGLVKSRVTSGRFVKCLTSNKPVSDRLGYVSQEALTTAS